MTTKSKSKSAHKKSQSRSPGAWRAKRAAVLRQGCRGPVGSRRVVYLATPVDQLRHAAYSRVRAPVAKVFSPERWCVFEPRRCEWTTSKWLRAWPRLLPLINAIVVWPRSDGSVGRGVYQEALDLRRLGKPVYVITPRGRLKHLRGLTLYRQPSLFWFARVQTGPPVQQSNIDRGGG